MSKLQDQLQTAIAQHRSGKLTEAESSYRHVLEINPDNADAVHLLGMVAQQTGRDDEAMQLLERAATLDPAAAPFHNNLGNALARKGNYDEAIASFRQAIVLRPNYAEAHHNLGLALENLGKRMDALAAFDLALASRPENVETHFRRGKLLHNLGRLQDAVASLRQAVLLRPDFVDAYRALAACYGDMGDQPRVIECHTRVAELIPKFAPAGSDLVHVLHYDPRLTAGRLFEAAVLWGKQFTEPITAKGIEPHRNDRSPDRKLRIGYVSADYRDHPIARLMVPILTHLDRSNFTAVCYSNTADSDDDRMNVHLRSLADEWRNVATVADEPLAQMIRGDRIDILVDLVGHMGGHRLQMFARKPAPIQLTQFNYPDTTGMSAMDYRMSDPLAEPPGASDDYSTEKLYRLPHCAWCYDPGFDIPDVGALPALSRGHITFCSLNKPIKHSAPTIALWSKILHAVPNSRLMLLGTDASVVNPALREPFAAHGIYANRLLFAPRMPRRKYMGLYNDADIALDPVPYNGGVTSCDAMWMGVPIVSIAGNTYHSRQGLMLLTNLGLPDLIARTAEEYVAIAVRLASDTSRLSELRPILRQRMITGHIADGNGFARSLEAAYRSMWRTWCEKHEQT